MDEKTKLVYDEKTKALEHVMEEERKWDERMMALKALLDEATDLISGEHIPLSVLIAICEKLNQSAEVREQAATHTVHIPSDTVDAILYTASCLEDDAAIEWINRELGYDNTDDTAE